MTRRTPPSHSSRFADRLRKISDAPQADSDYGSGEPPAARTDRKPTFRAATLTFITGDRIDVVVKNLNATGARVEFISNVRLPDRVMLSEPTARLQVWAYVTWQEPGAAGLEFVIT